MDPRARLVLIGFVALLLALLPALVDSPLAEPESSALEEPESSASEAVVVEHELVAATLVEEPAAPPREAAPTRGLPDRHTRPDGFLSRARQFLVGDGRHRPEPFPRGGQ